MKTIALFLCLSIFGFNFSVQANEVTSDSTAARGALIKSLAQDYILQKSVKNPLQVLTFTSPGFDRRCDDDDNHGRPPRTSCIDTVCNKLGTYGCDHINEINEVTLVCQNQDNGDCIESLCSKLGTYGCDHINEIKEVALSCENIRRPDCINVVCEKLGTYGCDHINELKEVANVCSGIRDTSCIKSVCERLGTYGCDHINELREVANSCKGR